MTSPKPIRNEDYFADRGRTLTADEIDLIRERERGLGRSPPSDLPNVGPFRPDSRAERSGQSTPHDEAGSITSHSPPSQRRIASGGNGPAPAPGLDDLTDRQKARIVRRHLVQKPGDASEDASIAEDSRDEEEAPAVGDSSYHGLLGGDAVHDLYRWESNQNAQRIRRPRSASFTQGITSRRGSIDSEDPTLDIQSIKQPGGFRRNYIQRKAIEEGEPVENQRFTRSFVDFLSLYGHYAGEELEEIDEEDEEDEDVEQGATPPKPDERRPLLRAQSSRRRQPSGAQQTGDASVLQAVLMLLKSFVGTGILFLGKAFYNGGILFSAIVLMSIALISLYSFLLLVETRLQIPASFGDIGGQLYGPWMRRAILLSLVLSQVGFVSAYTIFVAENMRGFVLAVTDGRVSMNIGLLIALEFLVLLRQWSCVLTPLTTSAFAMVRQIQKLSGTALVANVFILLGIIYIFGNEINVIADNGVADVVPFNSEFFPLLVGTAVFSFEGVGLVIPVSNSMKEPKKFPGVLAGVMVVVMVLFTGAGLLAYSAYGSKIQTVVLVNLPQDDKLVQGVQFLYSIAILLSIPLQYFPALRVIEIGVFGPKRSGKHDVKVKWQKNGIRAALMGACCLLAWAGADDLDKFVSLVGSFACVPLCFCYPAMLHYKVCKNRWRRYIDIALLVFGLCACTFTTINTIRQLATS